MNNFWLPVSKRITSAPQMEREVNGVRCKISLTPYDMPQMIRGFMDSKNREYVIELKYLNDEPLIPKKQSQFVTIEIGQNSNRIYKIKISADAMHQHAFPNAMQVVEMVIDELAPPEKANRISDQYHLTKDVILNNREMLFSGFDSQTS